MKQISLTLIPGLLVALMLQTPALAADANDYQEALRKADETLCDADSRVQLWSTSDILLDDAAKAAAAGDFDLAVTLVNEARIHAELAVATAEREKTTWQRNVPRLQPE